MDHGRRDEQLSDPPDRARGATRPAWTHGAGLALLTAGLALLAHAPFIARALVTAGAVLGYAEAPRAVVPRADRAWVYALHLLAVALGSAGLVALWLGPGGAWRAAIFAFVLTGVRGFARRLARPSLARRVRARMRAREKKLDALAARVREALARRAGEAVAPAEYDALVRARAALDANRAFARLATGMAALQLASWVALVGGLYVLWSHGASLVAGACLLAAGLLQLPAERFGLRALADETSPPDFTAPRDRPSP